MDWSSNELLLIFVLLLVIVFGAGCLVSFVGSRRRKEWITRFSLHMALVGSLFCVVAGIWFWQHPSTEGVALIESAGLIEGRPGFTMEFYVDPLAAFFVLFTGAFASLVTIYSFGWLKDVDEKHRVAGVYNLFILFTVLTILANNTYFMLLFLESMTLPFAYLVLFRHNKNLDVAGTPAEEMEASKTAFKAYLIFSHVGIVFITAAMLLLSISYKGADGLDFDILRDEQSHAPTLLASVIFCLSLVGLAIKAGVVPAHVWVPIVHPYSPTTTHAFSLGVTIKVAIYLMIRLYFDLLHPVQWWWGWLILLLAGVTALTGVFYALVARDLKTALAWHSIENIGIILVGLGLALICVSQEAPVKALAGLALVASLYHLLNHATFKGLLYLCTGAIENRTGVVELDKLGGLLKRYPWTGTAFLIGAVSISGFPPFNGFISEWLTLQSLMASMSVFGREHGLAFLFAILLALLLLGLAFGLTALAFVKIAGEALLGAPRSPEVAGKAKSGDVQLNMRGVIVFLAAGCLFLGVFPNDVLRYFSSLAGSLQLETAVLQPGMGGVRLNVPVQLKGVSEGIYQSELSIWLLASMVLILGASIVRALMKSRRTGRDVTVWNGGTPYSPVSMQPRGSSLTSLIWQPFSQRAIPGEELRPVRTGILPYRLFVSGSRYILDYFRVFYDWLADWLVRGSEHIGNWFQAGDIRRYLVYILSTLVAALIALMLFLEKK
jgi:hydrogenase-4 component B